MAIYPKHKRSEQGAIRDTINVNVMDERKIEIDHSTTKVGNIKSQSIVLDNTTTINDDKGYVCDLRILTSDSDTALIHHPRSNSDKESEQAVVREDITDKVIKERIIKENVSSNRKRENKKGQSNETQIDTLMTDGKINSYHQRIFFMNHQSSRIEENISKIRFKSIAKEEK